jgi:hypothetical protein
VIILKSLIVIELMHYHRTPTRRLPNSVKLTESFEVAPDTFSMSCLNLTWNDLKSARDPLESGFNDVAPWDFRLTEGEGLELIIFTTLEIVCHSLTASF